MVCSFSLRRSGDSELTKHPKSQGVAVNDASSEGSGSTSVPRPLEGPYPPIGIENLICVNTPARPLLYKDSEEKDVDKIP